MKKAKINPDELNQRIKQELGINLKEYRNEEIANNIVELVVFPSYILNWILRPVMISFVLFILGFFIIDLVHIEYVLYILLGFVLFIISGFLCAVWLFTTQMKQDIKEILNFAFETMTNISDDLKNVQSAMATNKKGEVLSLLFSGIIHISIIPVISSVVSNKLKFGSVIVQGFLKNTLSYVASQINFSDADYHVAQHSQEEMTANREIKENQDIHIIHKAQSGMNQFMNVAFNIGQFPIKTGAIIAIMVTCLFIYFLW